MKIISIEEAVFLEKSVFIDVRSPSEYKESTIPGAYNFPLFSDEERKEIGTLYHKHKEEAYEKGFEIGCSKLYSIFKSIKSLSIPRDHKVIVFCWRGGMRSRSIVANLSMVGINIFQLKGGYKAYRKFVLEKLVSFDNRFTFYNLHGNTGVGKTILLNMLRKKGEPVLDLEGLANNRGSIFGDIGLGEPRNQKMFDSLLFNELCKNKKNYFFIESESRRIGNVMLPDFLVSSMEKGNHILINADIDIRIKNLMDEYLPLKNKNSVYDLIFNHKVIRKKKGKEWVEHLLSYLVEDDYYNFIKILLLDYYDPLYSFSQNKYDPYDFIVSANNFQQCVEYLINIVSTNIDNNHDV